MNNTTPVYGDALRNAAQCVVGPGCQLSVSTAKYGSVYVRLHKPVARPTGLTLLQGRPWTPSVATDITKARPQAGR